MIASIPGYYLLGNSFSHFCNNSIVGFTWLRYFQTQTTKKWANLNKQFKISDEEKTQQAHSMPISS
jgi:hypothetical protein